MEYTEEQKRKHLILMGRLLMELRDKGKLEYRMRNGGFRNTPNFSMTQN